MQVHVPLCRFTKCVAANAWACSYGACLVWWHVSLRGTWRVACTVQGIIQGLFDNGLMGIEIPEEYGASIQHGVAQHGVEPWSVSVLCEVAWMLTHPHQHH